MWTGMPSKPRASKEEPGIFVLYLSGTWCHNTMTYRFQNFDFLPLPCVWFTSIRTSSWNFCLVEFAIPTQVLLPTFRWFSCGFQVVFRTTWKLPDQVVFRWSSDLRWSSPGIQVILILLLGGSLVLWGLVVIIVHIVNLTRHICKSNQNFGYQRSGHDRTGKLRREMRKVLMKTKNSYAKEWGKLSV